MSPARQEWPDPIPNQEHLQPLQQAEALSTGAGSGGEDVRDQSFPGYMVFLGH